MRRLIPLVLVFAVSCALGAAHVAAASAWFDTPPATSALHDPAAAPVAAVTDAIGAFDIAWPLGVLVGAYLLLELAAKVGAKNGIAKLAWLGQGRVSVAIAGATAVAAAAIDALAGGGTWMAALFAAASAATSYWHPAGTASSETASASSSSALATAVTKVAIVALLAAPSLGGCTWWAAEKGAIVTDVVDCTQGQYASLSSLAAKMASQLIVLATDGAGKVDTSQLKSAGLADGTAEVGCVLAKGFARLFATQGGSGSGAPQSSPLVVTSAAARAAMFELYPGKYFHTELGDL